MIPGNNALDLPWFISCKCCDECDEPGSWKEKLQLNIYAVILGQAVLDASTSPDRFPGGFSSSVLGPGSITHFLLPSPRYFNSDVRNDGDYWKHSSGLKHHLTISSFSPSCHLWCCWPLICHRVSTNQRWPSIWQHITQGLLTSRSTITSRKMQPYISEHRHANGFTFNQSLDLTYTIEGIQ